MAPTLGYSVNQGSPNPNQMSAKLHRFATKIAVRDSFALGLEQIEQIESKKLAKVRTTFKKLNILQKLYIFALAIQRKAQSHGSNT